MCLQTTLVTQLLLGIGIGRQAKTLICTEMTFVLMLFHHFILSRMLETANHVPFPLCFENVSKCTNVF